jgi:hypothetical protein
VTEPPRYRVLARPIYDHDVGEDDHDEDCAADHRLLVLATDPAGLGRPWEVLGAVAYGAAGTLDAELARDTVVAWLRLRPGVHADLDDVVIYLEVP